VGKITHYYDKIQVAVVKLVSGDLKVGDKVKLTDSAGEDVEQEIKSMQIEHAKIEIAKKGDEFGLKVDTPVKAKSDVVKV